MSRNRQVIIYSIGFLFGSLASSKPFLSDRWILVAFIGGVICSLTWAAFEKLDEVKKGKPRREEEKPANKVELLKSCSLCKGSGIIMLRRHGQQTRYPCSRCNGQGWTEKLNHHNAA